MNTYGTVKTRSKAQIEGGLRPLALCLCFFITIVLPNTMVDCARGVPSRQTINALPLRICYRIQRHSTPASGYVADAGLLNAAFGCWVLDRAAWNGLCSPLSDRVAWNRLLHVVSGYWDVGMLGCSVVWMFACSSMALECLRCAAVTVALTPVGVLATFRSNCGDYSPWDGRVSMEGFCRARPLSGQRLRPAGARTRWPSHPRSAKGRGGVV